MLAGAIFLASGSPSGAENAAGPVAESAAGTPAAFRALLPGALAGDPLAAYQVGRAYLDGGGRPEDGIEAARWLARAAEAGHGAAQLDLAMLYGKGLGVPQDYLRSYVWLARAAASLEAGPRRERALELRDMMAAFLSPAERAEAARLADEWAPHTAR